MRKNLSVLLIALSLCAALALPFVSSAQEEKKEHHHYKLIDIGTLGGPNSGLSGPGVQTLNNRGTFAAFANTSTSNPNPNGFIPFNAPDSFVEHPAVWHDGTLTELDVLPGGTNSQTDAISASGLIVGWSENGLIDPLSGLPEGDAVLWERGKVINLGTVPGGTESLATEVNGRGQVVGFSSNDIPDAFSLVGFPTQTRAFLWQNGVIRDLGTLGGPDALAAVVNERGQIAGMAYTNSTPNPTTGIPTLDPFLWENGTMTDLGNLGGTLGSANWLNNRGQVAGGSDVAGDMTEHPFLWTKSEGMKDLGGTFGHGNWINDAGEIVGISTATNDPNFHAFLWRDGVMTDLGTVGSDPNSEAISINSQGQVVGRSFDNATDTNLHGFLWEDGGPIVDLNTLVPPGSGVTVVFAFDINDRGEIAGLGTLPNGDERAVLLIPCDENHADVEGCDFDTVDAATVAQVRPAQTAQPSAAASQAKLSPAEMMTRFRSLMARRNHRFGTPQTSPK
jgi:probable HAF family extracellular repeat protein